MQARDKPVVLLVAEAVTLAHFARIAALAKALEADHYDVVVASDPRYAELEAPGFAFHPIRSIPATQFEQALARGKPLYSVGTLNRYVQEDLALLDAIKPDLVVGDFRLSLAVSAPVRHVPYAAVVNAYWSPYADISYPVPDLPMTRVLGVSVAQKLFNFVRPLAFALHAHPLNRVRRRYGLSPVGRDLRAAYTWADYTLYADAPALIPMRTLPANHRHLGPPLWSATVPLPGWWGSLPADRPVVLLTLGSSGRSDLVPMALSALSGLPVTVVVATAGKIRLTNLPVNVFVAEYLPLDRVIGRASLLVCNGGSLTTYQALASGVPVLGLCSNMDQLLNMGAVERLGAGLSLRAARVHPKVLQKAAQRLLGSPAYAQAAGKLGDQYRHVDAGQRFREFVAQALG